MWSEYDFKNYSLKYKKNWKTNVWNLELGYKLTKYFFWKLCVRVTGRNFFFGSIKRRPKESSLKISESDLNNKSLNTEKMKH